MNLCHRRHDSLSDLADLVKMKLGVDHDRRAVCQGLAFLPRNQAPGQTTEDVRPTDIDRLIKAARSIYPKGYVNRYRAKDYQNLLKEI